MTDDHADKPDNIIIYTGDDGAARVEVRFTGADVLMTQAQMASLYGVTKQTISEHLSNVFKDDELDEASVVRNFLTTAADGKNYPTDHYNLDAIISVGYRARGKRAVQFRKWATRILTEFAVKGFVVDVERLKDPDNAPDYFSELLEKIRDIRASERNVWKRITGLTTLCNDYDEAGQRQFFETFQNTVHWAVVQKTAAEIMFERVDAKARDCGVTHFKGKVPTVAEAHVAKNYYGEPELKTLNLLTTRLLDYFEDQSERRKVVTLADFEAKLKEFIKFDERPVLRHRGQVSMAKAKAKASAEIAAYKARIRIAKEAEGEATIRDLTSTAKAVTAKRKPRKTA